MFLSRSRLFEDNSTMNQSSSKTLNSNPQNANTNPVDLLAQLSNNKVTGCLELSYNSLEYFIYLYRGTIAYATNSLEPFERLERHLRRMSHEIPTLKSELRNSIKLQFDTEEYKFPENTVDYQAIAWLLSQKHLTKEQAVALITKIIREIFETFLLLPANCQHNFIQTAKILDPIGVLELSSLVEKCQKSLKIWHSFLPQISSSYQRPYFFSKPDANGEQQRIAKILRGFNFRQLAAILNQDELVIVKKFYPLIANKTIIIREPQAPFDLLPQLSQATIAVTSKTSTSSQSKSSKEDIDLENISKNNLKQKQWKIVCIDDSPTILNEMTRFLEGDDFSVFPISEPLKALMKIIRIKPDIILLDVGMPNIDGYKLCSLVRKYSAFQETPIVMVTGNKGLIDRAKARIAGATDYMTKPFTQSDLLNIVFRYLS